VLTVTVWREGSLRFGDAREFKFSQKRDPEWREISTRPLASAKGLRTHVEKTCW